MRVLLAHNFYKSSAPSGEDAVFLNEKKLLISNGIEVISYEKQNDEIDSSSYGDLAKRAVEAAWSTRVYNELVDLVRYSKPDIAHFHNTFPLISPSAYKACKDMGVPVVQTLHNYRLICPNALLLRNGKPCERCIESTLLNSLLFRCYRNSFLATGVVAYMLWKNRKEGSYSNFVDKYISLTTFSAEKYSYGGIAKEKIVVKPNFLFDSPKPGYGQGGYAVFVGRLSQEKGVMNLIEAWRDLAHIPLKILGDGPLRPEIEMLIEKHKLNIQLLGYCKQAVLLKIVSEAVFLIVPSEWYEGFPMVIVEAYAVGTPVLASNIGSLSEVVIDGVTGEKFIPGNAADLKETINHLWSDKELIVQIRENVREIYAEKYTADRNYQQLIEIYSSLIGQE